MDEKKRDIVVKALFRSKTRIDSVGDEYEGQRWHISFEKDGGWFKYYHVRDKEEEATYYARKGPSKWTIQQSPYT